ncbi:amino acid deaminase [Allostreptomyces psammosilenae]|uniref:D-serine deaminase-like pyridoxal phosphate-dependent protein n=1 Tax=Allostreptomyces psammosilenae TaxID=1892865 RepID=A0A853A1B2_9ACTN|nr:amino acid deaminase [Allostreptomyces psammosilenae]NYI08413.1 D-serine deaminase-like pyridoxal phosphate-dependent protein [Allostreptomyces psammosilenae]
MPQSQAGDTGIDDTAVDALREERLDWRHKAVPASAWGSTVAEFTARRPPLSELGTPLLTLDAGALAHNTAVMASWCAAAGVLLAPHGKTTMAPALWRRQLAAGAFGLTLANLPQLRVARAFGVRRLQLANTLLDPAGLAWLAQELDRDPEFSFLSWVDSPRSVALMDAALRAAGARRPVEVLVELGAAGGRTGCRTEHEALAVAEAVRATPTLALAGVGGYEGALAHDASAERRAAVQTYLRRLRGLHGRLRERYETTHPVVTAGGSAFFDQVVEVLAPLATDGTRVVLRSGAYQIHDDGFYRGISPFARGAGDHSLRSAMHGWAQVVSRPEPGLALLNAGKRDLPFDEGLPEPQAVRGARRGGEETPDDPLTGARVTALNDQHAFLRLPNADGPAIGDIVRLGLSHPCTAFDKWSLIPVVDDAQALAPVVVDMVRTFF